MIRRHHRDPPPPQPKKSGTSDDLADVEGGQLPQSSPKGERKSKLGFKSGEIGLSKLQKGRFYDKIKFKIWREVLQLNKKRDVLCLILSYPPFNSRDIEKHRGWMLDILKINDQVRESLHKKKKMDLSELSNEINRLLNHSIHDLKAHVPSRIIEEMCRRWFSAYTTLKKPMLDLCIDDFMIRQILQYIQFPEIRRILISGATDKTFLCKLKKLPPIRQMFDIVIHINAYFCRAVKGVEDRIIEELGFSKSSRGEAVKFLRSQNFLILLDNFHGWQGTYGLGNGWWNSDKAQKIAFINSAFDRDAHVDLAIWREDHLLSWNLFCRNANEVVRSSSIIQLLAVDVLRQCSGHLLASVLIARALKEVNDISIWQHASRVIGFLPTSHSPEDRILLNALAFVLQGQLGSAANKCVKHCAFYLEMEGTHKVDLLERWMKEDLIGTLDEGDRIVQQLVNVVLLESFQNGESIRMPDEVHKGLVNFYKAEMKPILLVELDGRGIMEAPESEAWEEANEMYLMNNKISKLPDNPNCPLLTALFLHGNHHLRVISPSFFQFMPILQTLNLSQTKIKSLPQSLFKLVQLRKFILRSCELFKELPAEIGELCLLEVLDLEETEIINLPVTVGTLTNLRSLKVSFYLPANDNRKSNLSNRIIPQNVISRLVKLEALSIDVNPENEKRNETIKHILKEVCCLNRLHFLKLHLPIHFLLNDLRNLSWMHFRIIVGDHLKRVISRMPHDSAIKFEEQESCLKYVNGVGIPTEIKEVLQHTTAFFLDRHITATSLSEFGVKTMKNLKSCVVQECNEIQTIVSANDADDGDAILLLEYLSVHYMKNLRSIWKGRIRWSSLFFLKVLALYSCPQLTTIFTWDLVQNLNNLEDLVVEDCPKIKSLVPLPDEPSWRAWYLPKLKKMSLHYMPKLVSVFGGHWNPPSLEWLSIYDCPSLKILSPGEVHSSPLKVIIGEADWWSALKSKASYGLKSRKLDDIFIPIERDIDLRTQLAAINDQLQAQMQKTEPTKQSGPDDFFANPIVEAGTSSKEKQVT